MQQTRTAADLKTRGGTGRTTARGLVLLALAGGMLGAPLVASGQAPPVTPAIRKIVTDNKNKPSAPPNKGGESMLDPMAKVPITETIIGRVLKQEEKKDLLLEVDLRVDGYRRIFPDGTTVEEKIEFQTAAVIYPVPPMTSSSTGTMAYKDAEDFKAELMFDGVLLPQSPSVISGYSGGQQFYKWTATGVTANTMLMKLKLPVTCGKLVFDESLAMSVPWPANGYPAVVNSVMQIQLGIDYMHNLPGKPEEQRAETQKMIDELLKTWTGGEDPKKIRPVYLAKFLAGKTIEFLQPSGDGLAFNRNTSFSGFDLQGVAATLRTQKGSEYDIHCALTAIYRRAGLPARVVIGWDRIGNSGGQKQRFRSWVEFAIVDPISNTEVWIPVDIIRQRRVSSRAGAYDRRWEYFGGIIDFQQVVPMTFHFHPPTTVENAGAPCLWGWMTTPTSQVAIQTLNLSSRVAPVRGGKEKDATK